MKLAFYYHIPIYRKNEDLMLPGFLGVFVDSLAANVDELYLILHEANESEKKNSDYVLKNSNIKWINLGKSYPAWHRSFFPWLTFKKIKEKINVDCIIVRSPSPLSTSFQRYFPNLPVYYMIVGDYLDGADHLKKSSFRDRVIYYYLKIFDWQFNKVLKDTEILVNSPALIHKYAGITKRVELISTTTISKNDIENIKRGRPTTDNLHLLFTGRIDPAKGLFELVNAAAILNKKYSNLTLSIVGWEESFEKPVENQLIELASKLNIKNQVIFHGLKKVGEELFDYYRKSDIYVLPSYHEGFPRTIWEAMAKGTPVIASAVGGIPEYLTDKVNCLLIKSHNVQAIVDSVDALVQDNVLREKIIKNAFQIVETVTLEKQSDKIIKIVKSYLYE